ncbi:F-box/LRR-repeat protein 20-like isoform X2 [Branchiostoma floridae]|uniref:F-box/LRR-repeat protein 20-like isoform X2 n=1 Tax=Branchiostoma floridae TaxID=7739 RepID=A0A9J7HIF0_BRAFL|nr:F-box/LRR-repeat protein 20-like isoform X2 [Branchiostoma floridae]
MRTDNDNSAPYRPSSGLYNDVTRAPCYKTKMAATLPVEVIAHVMRFLSVGDRKASALVNRQWYEASLDPALQTNTVFHLLTPFTSGSTVQKFGLRKSPNLILNDMDGSSRSKEVVKKACQHLGQHLQSLSLKGSDITEGTFMVIIPHCCNLRKLDLSLCNSLFLSGNLLRKPNDFQAAEKSLVNVRELNLGSLRHLSDCVFNRLVTVMPNVEKLSLSGCTISYEFSPYDKESKTRASTSVLTFVNIKAFLERQGKKLTSLNLSKTGLPGSSLRELAMVSGLAIRELNIAGNRDLNDDDILALVKQQNGLTSLDVAMCGELTSQTVLHIQTYVPQIQYLNFSKCRRMRDSAASKLYTLPDLQYINFAECPQISSKALVSGLSSKPMLHLASVCLAHCTLVRDEFVETLGKAVPHLKELDLTSCLAITDRSMHAIAAFLPELKRLSVAWCKNVTDYGILGLEKPSEEITQEEALVVLAQHDAGKPTGLQHLARLRVLDLSTCQQLSDLGITCAIRFRELVCLRLNMCTGVTDQSLVAIATNVPSLEELSISQCHQVTDDGVTKVVKRLQRLTFLDISCNDKLTNCTLASISQYCHCLQKLDVSLCSQMSHDALDKLQCHLPHLVSLQSRLV